MNIVTRIFTIPVSCVVLLSSLSPISAMAEGETLVIEAGTTYTVTKENSEMFLTDFTVGDNAVINFDSEVSRWHLEASSVTLGKGVVIDASALPGAKGGIGKSASGSADKCTDGNAGEDGTHGGNGSDGRSISMRLVIDSIGSVVIKSNGGAGGVGGRGGAGQHGGKVVRCTGPDGGAGGQGGDGGDGGNGGYVRIAYSYKPGSVSKGALTQYVAVENSGGLGGVGASGGNGGGGAEGKYINMRTLTGSKKWMPAGQTGQMGRLGKKGRVGVAGQTLMDRDLEGQMNVIASSQSQQQGSVADLRESMALERSLTAKKAEAAAMELVKVNAELALFKQQSEELKAQLSTVVTDRAQSNVSAATEAASLQGKVKALEAALVQANLQLETSNTQVEVLASSMVAIQAAQASADSESAKSRKLIERLLERVVQLEARPSQQVIKEKIVEKVVQKEAKPSVPVVSEKEKASIGQ
ncbi:hypothetical protein A9Q99_14440 [Gammaproteobacteria bacterium 45_16_T64]|nr:hypothetical protein A9Q99_14440 [Gammaproteobacteria bacterium 45_16_T64]